MLKNCENEIVINRISSKTGFIPDIIQQVVFFKSTCNYNEVE